MTSSIFEDWLRKLDRRFKTQRHQVLMVVDNCPAHPKLNNLEAITLVFLPPNTTSRLHLCDMGIIKNLKVKYRKLVARRFLDSIENKTVSDSNVLDAMQMLRSAWRDVTAQTVANCFHQAGFAAALCNGANDSPDPPAVQAEEEEEDDDIPLARLFPAGGVTFDDYATADDAVETCKEPSVSDIAEEVLASRIPSDAGHDNNSDMEEEDEDQHNTDATSAAPSTSDVMTAIDTLRRFLYAAPSSDAAQEQLMSVESFVIYGR